MVRNLQALHNFLLVCFCMIGFDVLCDWPSDILHFFQNHMYCYENKHNYRLHFTQKYARISFCPWKLSVPQSSHKYGLGKLFAFPYLFIKRLVLKKLLPLSQPIRSKTTTNDNLLTLVLFSYTLHQLHVHVCICFYFCIVIVHCNWPERLFCFYLNTTPNGKHLYFVAAKFSMWQ